MIGVHHSSGWVGVSPHDSAPADNRREPHTSQEHGHVGVMAAGMHLAGVSALKWHIHLLLHAW